MDNISDSDLADMQLRSISNKGTCFLLCIIDICSKYAWVFQLKAHSGLRQFLATDIPLK